MNRALIVIDVQESFRVRRNWRIVGDPEIGKPVQRLVDAARAAGDLVVWVLHSEPGSGSPFDPASGNVRVFDELTPLSEEPTITKTSRNAFSTTNLQQLLTKRGIHDLTLCGIQTEQCVETTARVGADLGYAITFVTDATTTFPIAHRDAPAGRSVEEIVADPRTLQVDDIVTRTEYALAGRFATVVKVGELTGS
ncbi:cysteine hydrolase family protein [Actinoplanes sp. N902-109]|uniref:cysteine hydrolase family protein n=1 Tax=Actinoplanes sp. (strain N902-109) TaxID=649831 RepID=UPI0003294952|nr:isochorismatase family protein [Actinoplanes sp. N902-109]AGL19902.1 putative hydrolase [Actinoplanes sp. N902-109]